MYNRDQAVMRWSNEVQSTLAEALCLILKGVRAYADLAHYLGDGRTRGALSSGKDKAKLLSDHERIGIYMRGIENHLKLLHASDAEAKEFFDLNIPQMGRSSKNSEGR